MAQDGLEMSPPVGGAIVRMFRIGHGDCFLIALGSEQSDNGKGGRPAYMLIDCGYKPGSPTQIVPPTQASQVAANILETTGNALDIAVLTHEHQDHVNGITYGHFNGLKIEETWVGWTEDPNDALANGLRLAYKDQLRGLLSVRNKLDLNECHRLRKLLELEVGGSDESVDLDLSLFEGNEHSTDYESIARWTNKHSMSYFKSLANCTRFLNPGESFQVPKARGVTVYVLGPPRDADKLKDLDPEGGEIFGYSGHGSSNPVSYFCDGLQQGGGASPFVDKYVIDWDEVDREDSDVSFYLDSYGEIGENDHSEFWRRIDFDWLNTAEHLAIDMNSRTNNSSVVLAIELSPNGKVLLFAADAQAGNWRSWSNYSWKSPDGRVVNARDLLARTVLYKVGHHCSHNATLKGEADSLTPTLGWMATEPSARSEFSAMITAVEAWAKRQDGWNHPMPEIKDALKLKAAGRVLQTDTMPDVQTKRAFSGRLVTSDLFFDLEVLPLKVDLPDYEEAPQKN